MEGPLSKWTNVVQGWQYRWFVLDLTVGVLSYYTSKDKMVRGERRGCVKLKNAQVGINDEDDSTFTITVDSKMFHFQAQNSEERQKWLDALQEARDLHTENYALLQQTNRLLDPATSVSEFDRRIIEADAYLQILIDQHQQLDQQLSHVDYFSVEACEKLKFRLQHLIELVKKTIVCLQFAKENSGTTMVNLIDGPFSNSTDVNRNGFERTSSRCLGETFSYKAPLVAESHLSKYAHHEELGNRTLTSASKAHLSCNDLTTPPASQNCSGVSHSLLDLKSGSGVTGQQSCQLNRFDFDSLHPLLNISESTSPKLTHLSAGGSIPPIIPDISYSSSEEENEEFFDTWENLHSTSPALSSLRYGSFADRFGNNGSCGSDSLKTAISTLSETRQDILPVWRCSENIPLKYKSVLAYDDLYDEDDETDLGSLQSQGSVISYLLSQLRIGMDLTRITLPTFILEKRSTLEMYADFLAHPDLWIGITEGLTPRDRMVECLRWYLSAFHAGRRSAVCKKPYNPILGEVFRCCWPMTDESLPTSSRNASPTAAEAVTRVSPAIPEVYTENDFAQFGPLPFAVDDCVVFLSEQVSHHPPISAFYAEYMPKRIQISGHIWTKSKFLGLSIGVEMVGSAVISLIDLDEEYEITFPSAYGRNILSVPWLELGGKCTVTCAKTNYSATVEFRTKPFYGGKKDQIRAEAFSPNDKKPFVIVEGEWNGQMLAKWADGTAEIFVDTKAIPIRKKRLRPRSIQTENESRRLWQEVTHSLKVGSIDAATDAKTRLESRQRMDAATRQENSQKWQPHYFFEQGDSYVYRWPLAGRIGSDSLADEARADFTLTNSNVSSFANGLDSPSLGDSVKISPSDFSFQRSRNLSSLSLSYCDSTKLDSVLYVDAMRGDQVLNAELDC